MKKHYETHVEDTDKLISVAGPVLDYKSWYEQYRKLMEEQAQRKHGLYTPTSEGDDDDFPSIPGMVARYSALGLTNEQMAENPVWKDLTGNGHDLQMKNFAWGGMSGVGGYGDENYQTFYKFTLDDYVFIASPPGVKHMNFTFRVTGLQPGNKLTLAFFGTTNTVYGIWDKDGIYTVDADIVEAGKPTYFYNGYGATRGEFTIEILPLYPGALVFDGVDDYGVCENFPILTKEKGYTVVALRQWISTPTRYTALVSRLNIDTGGSFVFEEYNNGWLCGSFGEYTEAITVNNNNPISWQTSKSYNGESINVGTYNDTDVLSLGKLYYSSNKGEFANIALYSLVILDHDATEEELTKIKDYFVKTYPWLFFDQAWTVVGKTNEDEDRATIANITGNGNDLVLSNFGFAQNSGYGLYYENFSDRSWYKISERIDYTVTGSSIFITAIKKVNSLQILKYISGGKVMPSMKVKISGLPDGVTLDYETSKTILFSITGDGVYTLPSYTMDQTDLFIGFKFSEVQESCNITIEQIPEYEGYLVTDGVDDTGRAVGLTISKDFTLVGEWILFSKTSVNAGLSIHPQIHIFNRPEAIQIIFRTAGKTLPVKSLKAICSDGRCYDENWSELKINVGEFTDNKGTLFVASNGTNCAQIAFKNLGIYDNQLLSKDDCIKAYNYLQTLKAK